ncbi:MAG: cytochrome c [SAR324 cluster bacterium]|nr:cytochrome c [SAR324 cluster bacterium]
MPFKKPKSILLFSGIGTVLLLLAIFIVSYIQSKPISAAPSAQEIEQGAQIFLKNCKECHGEKAIGEDPKQSKGGIKADGTYLAPALNGTGHAWHHPWDVLFQTIKNGSIAQDSAMRGFKGKLTDEEIKMVILYIKSLWPEKIRTRYEKMMH